PGSVLGLYLLVRGVGGTADVNGLPPDRIVQLLGRITPARFVRTVWAVRPFKAIVALLLVAGPWFAAVGWRNGVAFLYEFCGLQNFGRLVGAMDSHSG